MIRCLTHLFHQFHLAVCICTRYFNEDTYYYITRSHVNVEFQPGRKTCCLRIFSLREGKTNDFSDGIKSIFCQTTFYHSNTSLVILEGHTSRPRSQWHSNMKYISAQIIENNLTRTSNNLVRKTCVHKMENL